MCGLLSHLASRPLNPSPLAAPSPTHTPPPGPLPPCAQGKKDTDEIAALTRRLKAITDENDATETAVSQVRHVLWVNQTGPPVQLLTVQTPSLFFSPPCRRCVRAYRWPCGGWATPLQAYMPSSADLPACCVLLRVQLRKQLTDLQATSAAAAAAAAKVAAALQAQVAQGAEEAAALRRRVTELEGKAKAATEAHAAAAVQLAEATRLHAPCGQRIAALEDKGAKDAAEVRCVAGQKGSGCGSGCGSGWAAVGRGGGEEEYTLLGG